MHLTDYREQCLKDVITQLEPGLFKKVTGLSVKDFELLVSLGVFRDSVMNDAVYKFRLYEGALLEYTGLNRHEYDSNAGLFDTTLFAEDYAQMKLQDSLLNPDGTTRDRNNAMVVASEIADARFEFSLRGSKASGGRSAWWRRGFPEMAVPEWTEPPPSRRRSSTLWSRETPFSARLSAMARSWASTASEEPSRLSSGSTRRAGRSTASFCSRTCSSRAC